MKLKTSAVDIRQSPQWGDYLKSIGWKIDRIGNQQIFIKQISILNKSILKMQHPQGPLDFKKIESISKKYNSLMTVIEPHVNGFDEKEYLRFGYKVSKINFAPSSTILIDLKKGEKELFNSFSENAKRNIKKSLKNNLEIEIVEMKKEKTFEAFEEYYNLLKNLRKIKGFYAPGYSESYKKMKAFQDNSLLIFAKDKNIPIAVVWLAFYKNTICYMQTGITQKGYKLLANYLLVWEGLSWAKKNKLSVFDFESIYDPRFPEQNKRWIGYSEFKKRFHGEIILYPIPFVKFYSNLFKILFSFGNIFTKYPKRMVFSKINGYIEIRKTYGKDTIFVNQIPQSGGELYQMWHKVILNLATKNKINNCLVLGIGGGDVIREIQNNFKSCKITAVEIDPVMLELAKEKFGTKDKNTIFKIADAISFVYKEEKNYDLIIVDLFIGRFNPPEAREKKFLNKLESLVRKDGFVLFNSHYQKENKNELFNYKNLCKEYFKNTEEIFAYRRNKILVLSKS